MRTTKAANSLVVSGLPTGWFCALASYFPAMSFRCHRSNVSGVTMAGSSDDRRIPKALARAAMQRRWSVIEPESLCADLSSQNSILLGAKLCGCQRPWIAADRFCRLDESQAAENHRLQPSSYIRRPPDITAARYYRWCKPPSRGHEMIFPGPSLRALSFGVLLLSPRWMRSWWK